jgi:predicted RNA-binding protein YlxR (DUF448 family)
VSKKGHVPVRMCIGCRKKREKGEMIRLTQQSPEGVVKVSQKEPHRGRGFYLCPDLLCLNMAKRKNKGVRFLETVDFQFPSIKGFLDRGRRE